MATSENTAVDQLTDLGVKFLVGIAALKIIEYGGPYVVGVFKALIGA